MSKSSATLSDRQSLRYDRHQKAGVQAGCCSDSGQVQRMYAHDADTPRLPFRQTPRPINRRLNIALNGQPDVEEILLSTCPCLVQSQ
jgi:hypothetical protein